jgi:putative spermidine/putrescine transport system permease protein
VATTALDQARARPQDRVIRRPGKQRDWAKWGLGAYFGLFLVFLYGPMIVMAILSFQGYYGGVTFPFQGPFSALWWKSLVYDTVAGTPTHAEEIQTAVKNSLLLSFAAGVLVAILSFTTSMAFRRRWRFKSDAAGFYLLMLALMTPGFLLALGTQLFWRFMDMPTSMWKTALGTNVIWGIPFGFLVMLAVWNRYDEHIEEAARDLGADQKRTFREVTLPLVWTGVFGSFLFGFTLTWNDYDRTLLLIGGAETQTLPLQIAGLTFTAAIRPDLYALGTATTVFTLLIILIVLVIASIRLRRTRGAPVHRIEEELGLEEVTLAEAGGQAQAS